MPKGDNQTSGDKVNDRQDLNLKRVITSLSFILFVNLTHAFINYAYSSQRLAC